MAVQDSRLSRGLEWYEKNKYNIWMRIEVLSDCVNVEI